MDKVDATPTGTTGVMARSLPWQADAQVLLEELVAAQPVLIQISVAKRLRDRAEREAREAGEDEINAARLLHAQESLHTGVTA
jgi:chlorophyllide a reductase subunit Z